MTGDGKVTFKLIDGFVHIVEEKDGGKLTMVMNTAGTDSAELQKELARRYVQSLADIEEFKKQIEIRNQRDAEIERRTKEAYARAVEDLTRALADEKLRLGQVAHDESMMIASKLEKVTRFLLTKSAFTRYVEQALADLRQEYAEAKLKGDEKLARMVKVRGYLSIIHPFIWGLFSLVTTIWRISRS